MPRMLGIAALASPPVLAGYGVASCVAVAAMMYKAMHEQPDAHMAATWITHTNACLAVCDRLTQVVFNFMCFVFVLNGRILQRVLLGPLRIQEFESLQDALRMEVFDGVFTLSVLLPKFDVRYILLGSILIFLRIFQSLCAARIESMGQVPTVPRHWHVRMVLLLSFLQTVYMVLVPTVWLLLLSNAGPNNAMLYFMADVIVHAISLSSLVVMYGLTVYDLLQEHAWEGKSRYVFATEFLRDFCMLTAYISCYYLSFKYLSLSTWISLPFNALYNVAVLGYSLLKRTRLLYRFVVATRDMEHRYPALTSSDVAQLGDPTCIICREEFVPTPASEGDVARKLPCGHVFHFRCLHAWLERQQSCPTCRRDVLGGPDEAARSPTAQNADAAPPAPEAPPTPSTLQEVLNHWRQAAPQPDAEASGTPADAARALLHELRPSLAERLVRPVETPKEHIASGPHDVPTSSPSSSAPAPPTVDTTAASSNKGPVLIPLFDPTTIPHFESQHAPHLPFPLAEWIRQDTPQREEARASGPVHHDQDALREHAETLQKAQQLLAQAAAQLTVVLEATAGPAAEAPASASVGKGKSPEHDAP